MENKSIEIATESALQPCDLETGDRAPAESFTPARTEDGSGTFFSLTFGETFHSPRGAKLEAREKFVEPCLLSDKARRRDRLYLLDICYGLGYNTAAALDAIWTANPACRARVYALEADVKVPQSAAERGWLEGWRSPVPEMLSHLARAGRVQSAMLDATLLVGDARQTLRQVCDRDFRADGIFLDPFSPLKCPQLWSVEFLALAAACLAADGRLATYSCAAAVRVGLQLAGLQVGTTTGLGRRSTVAGRTATDLPPLWEAEREHLHTRAAIPYRDPQGNDDTEAILQRRQQEQAVCSLEATSRWRKRWRDRAGEEFFSG